MHHFLNKGGSKIEVNTLFIQPTRDCALECKGCYVKEHIPNPNQIDLRILVEVFKHFYLGEEASANQITISLDNMPKDNQVRSAQMFDFALECFDFVARHKTETSPEVHVTVHDLATLESYSKWTAETLFVAVDLISLSYISESDLPAIQKIQSQYKVKINFNHMIPHNVSSNNIDSHVKHLTAIGEVVDFIYLLMFKRPIHDKLVRIGDTERMRKTMAYAGTMFQRLPPAIANKITVDGCLEDAIRHSKTGQTCSSNVSRFQIWPDGSVTGCAYAFGGDRPEGKTVNDIMDNIRLAQKESDFRSKCYLPEVYNSIKSNGLPRVHELASR
jgi:hypothetical protein